MTEETANKKVYEDDELREMSIEDANSILNDEQFERWNELHTEELKQEAREHKQVKQETRKEALDIVADSARDEVYDEIKLRGATLRVNCSLNNEQQDAIQRIQKLSDNVDDKNEDVDVERFNDFQDALYEVLGAVLVDYDKRDVEDKFSELGLTGIRNVANEAIQKYMDKINEKEEVVEKFQQK